jgi:hypothetical protein
MLTPLGSFTKAELLVVVVRRKLKTPRKLE